MKYSLPSVPCSVYRWRQLWQLISLLVWYFALLRHFAFLLSCWDSCLRLGGSPFQDWLFSMIMFQYILLTGSPLWIFTESSRICYTGLEFVSNCLVRHLLYRYIFIFIIIIWFIFVLSSCLIKLFLSQLLSFSLPFKFSPHPTLGGDWASGWCLIADWG